MNQFSSSDLSDYQENGFLIARSLFSNEEIELLGQTARADNAMDKSSTSRDDGDGNAVRLALWNHPGDGIYGMFARSKRLVNRVEQLLDDEAYHYHSKMVLKDAKIGGAWYILDDAILCKDHLIWHCSNKSLPILNDPIHLPRMHAGDWNEKIRHHRDPW